LKFDGDLAAAAVAAMPTSRLFLPLARVAAAAAAAVTESFAAFVCSCEFRV
jgi:hypothetical protein